MEPTDEKAGATLKNNKEADKKKTDSVKTTGKKYALVSDGKGGVKRVER